MFGYAFPALPYNGWWSDVLQPYVKSTQLLRCPSDQSASVVSYGVNYSYGAWAGFSYGNLYPPHSLADFRRPAENLAIIESQGTRHVYNHINWPINTDTDSDGIPDSNSGTWAADGYRYNCGAPFRHNRGSNCLFFDGHVKWISGWKWLTDLTMWDCSS